MSPESGSAPRPNAADHPLPVTHVPALARAAMDLADDLERAWSSALEPEVLDAAHEGLRASWSTLLAELHRAIAEADVELAAAGIDVTLREWPPSRASAVELALAPEDPLVARKQLQVAQLMAFEQLTRVLGALTKPSGREVNALSGEEISRWWEAGAFALVRAHGEQVLRLTRAMQVLERRILEEQEPEPRQERRESAAESFQMASAAYRLGDPEAALLHAVRAARARLASLHESGELPRDFDLAVLRTIPAYDDQARLLQLAQEAVNRMLSGDDLDPGVPLPLVGAVLPVVQGLMTHPPVEQLAETLSGISSPPGETSADDER